MRWHFSIALLGQRIGLYCTAAAPHSHLACLFLLCGSGHFASPGDFQRYYSPFISTSLPGRGSTPLMPSAASTSRREAASPGDHRHRAAHPAATKLKAALQAAQQALSLALRVVGRRRGQRSPAAALRQTSRRRAAAPASQTSSLNRVAATAARPPARKRATCSPEPLLHWRPLSTWPAAATARAANGAGSVRRGAVQRTAMVPLASSSGSQGHLASHAKAPQPGSPPVQPPLAPPRASAGVQALAAQRARMRRLYGT